MPSLFFVLKKRFCAVISKAEFVIVKYSDTGVAPADLSLRNAPAGYPDFTLPLGCIGLFCGFPLPLFRGGFP